MLVCRRTRRQPRREDGAVAVEFALVLPILVMLLLGITTAGLSYSRALGLTNAVREGSRFGATALANNPTQWSNNVIQRVQETQFDDPSAPSTGVCVQLWKIDTGVVTNTARCNSDAAGLGVVQPSTATQAPAVPTGATGVCVVRVIAARTFTIDIGLLSWTRVNRSTSVARYERTDDKVSACS